MKHYLILIIYFLSPFIAYGQGQENVRPIHVQEYTKNIQTKNTITRDSAADVALQTTYVVDSNWGTGYSAHITLTNVSNMPISSWMVQFALLQGQTINTIWNGHNIPNLPPWNGGSTTGNDYITVSNEEWNGFLNPQQTVSIGFQVNNPQATSSAISNVLGIGNASTSASTSQQAQFPLTAGYAIDSSWSTGYQATVTLTNNTANPTSSWVATFVLPQGQSVTSLWNGLFTTQGQTVTVTNAAWVGAGIIPGNASTTFGFIVNKSSSDIPTINNLQALANSNTSAPTPIPNAPILNPISVSTVTPNTYTVSWSSVSYASSYILQQAATSDFSNAQVVAQGTMLSQTFNNQPNGTYYYRVLASNATGTSPLSNTQNIVINVQPIQLKAPVLQSISNPSGSNQYNVSWNAVSNAQGYILQQASDSNFSNPSTVFNGSSISTQVSVQIPGTYYYRVYAFAGNAISSLSNIISTVVTQQPPQAAAFIDSYWESWNSADPINTIINMHVDIINIAFANFKTTGTHTYVIAGIECDQATLTQFVTLAHNVGKKVKIAIGGATYPLSSQLQTTQDAIGMAQAIAQFVQQNSLDGVDFDIEDYPAPALQIALLQNTRQLLGNNALISYTPKSPASTTLPYDQVIQGGHQYVSYISIMAYDYAPGYNYQQDAQALIAMGVPASKIVIGLMPGMDDVGVMTSVANITTAAQYIRQNGLGGIMFWDLNRDLENQTGIGASAATNTAWNILH